MKTKFATLYQGCLFCLALTAGWTLWAQVETATNLPASKTTNEPSSLIRQVERLEQHSLTFRLDEIAPLREHHLFGEPLWKYLASGIYILLAFYASKLIDWVARVWLRKLAAKTETKIDDLLLDLLHGPVKVVVFVVLLNIGLSIFNWSPAAILFFSKGLVLVVAASLTYLAIKVINLLLDIWRRRHAQEPDVKFDDQLFLVLRIAFDSFIIVVASLVTAQNLNINITAAIASLSVGGLAVGLAAQDTLANLFGAVAVFVDKPFRVGDQIRLEGAEGVVEVVGLRSTRVRNPDGHLVAVPNKTVGNAIITNVTQRPAIKTMMNLALARTLPANKVRSALTILGEIYRGHAKTQEAWISFNQFSSGNANILIVHWWKGTNYQEYLAGMQEMNLAVK